MFKGLAFAAAVLMGGFFMPAAEAREVFCGKEDPSANLKTIFGEAPYAAMLTHSGLLQVIYLNSENGTWSIVVQPPGAGLWCFMNAGENWSHFTNDIKKKKGIRS
jgi:hypothetical protein